MCIFSALSTVLDLCVILRASLYGKKKRNYKQIIDSFGFAFCLMIAMMITSQPFALEIHILVLSLDGHGC